MNKPSVVIVSSPPHSAVDNIMQPVAAVTGADLIHPHEVADFDFTPYSLVHVGWPGLLSDHLIAGASRISTNVWGISVERLQDRTYGWINAIDHAVVDDVMTLQLLGQLGFTSVSLIPLAFAHEHFTPLPPPDTPFTVGIFGNNYPSKRFDIVLKACKLAGVRCHAQVFDPHRTQYNLDPVRDVYQHIHAFAHASLTDTNNMTGYEALLCDRPLISTHNFGVRRFLREGYNGLFFDGSVSDLAEKIKRVKDDYACFRAGCAATPKPSLEESTKAYAELFARLCAEDD